MHFIGVGGAGMSAIAKVLLEMGVSVSGSDLKESRYTKTLAELGADISIGHDPANLKDPAVVVISSAIPEYNPELRAARERGLNIVPRARMLSELCRKKPQSVAVGGTHGKTTTTSMIALILERAGWRPTFLIGGELNDIGSNAQYGDGDTCVVEADESDGSLVNLSPALAVITNVDRDHLDYHGDFATLQALFVGWIKSLPAGAKAVVYGDGSKAEEVARASGREYLSFGRDPENFLSFRDEVFSGSGAVFKVRERGVSKEVEVALRVPGEHNILNAMAALAIVRTLGMDLDTAAGLLADFRGAQRRFQQLGDSDDILVIDDYAHHPTEIKATVTAAAAMGRKRVICVFQPHRFSRTQLLSREFGDAFPNADLVVLTNIYNAGEQPIPGVSGKLLVDEILSSNPTTRISYIPDKADIGDYLIQIVRSGDIVLMMGAGDIGGVGHEFARRLAEVG